MPNDFSHSETDRLATLTRYAVLDTAPEAAFERITSLAARLFGMPIARISFVDEARIWFKSSFGMPAGESPRAHATCGKAILSDEVFVVPDAAADPLFLEEPLVMKEPRARFYAGAPLCTADGFNLGVLCLIDLVPRAFDADQQESLKQMAALVVDALQTRLANRQLAAEVEVRQQAEAALGQSQAGRTTMLAAAFDAIIGLDQAGRIIELNPAAERLFGHSLATAAGQEMAELLIAPRPRAEYRRDIGALFADGGAPLSGERKTVWALHADGTEFPVEMVLTRVNEGGPWAFTSHVRDLSAQHAGENRLRMLESSLVHANDAIIVTEAEPLAEPGPRIIYANEAFTRATGYTLEEVLGKTPRILQGPNTDPAAKRKIHDAVLQWQEVRVELINYRKDGSEFWVELNIVPVSDGQGNWTHWVSVQRIITERKQEQQALEQARDEADRANAAKSEFLSRMSHELRTPLNAILGFGQLLEMQAQTDRQRENVSHILKGGQHLLDLINEVLDISRIESGKIELTPTVVKVSEVFNEAAALIQPLATRRNVLIGRCMGQACDGEVLADRQRLRQVVLNLLSNAVKYNRPGGTVSLSCDPAARAGFLRLSVGDTGPGLSAADCGKLFVPFERLGAEGSGVEGTGIGLALSKRLVEAMEGSIGVESTPGRGSTFYVELPASGVWSSGTGQSTEPVPDRLAVRGPTVLYIEDNASNYTLVEQVLEMQRPTIRLLGAMLGQLGLDMAREHRPDLILLDLQLPDLPGQEVLRQLQADDRTQKIPVLMVSANATAEQPPRLLELGARAYLTKPLKIGSFLKALDETLDGDAGPLPSDVQQATH